jgi:hypothetical protein
MALDIAIFSQSAMDRNCWPPTQNGFSSEPESNFEAYWVPKFEVIMECQAESLSNHVQPNISRLPSISNGRQVHLFVGPQKAQQHQRFWGSLTSEHPPNRRQPCTQMNSSTGPQQEMGCTVPRMISYDSQEKTNRLLRSIWWCQSWASPQHQYGGPDRIIAWRQTGMLPLGGGLWIAGICWDDVQKTSKDTSQYIIAQTCTNYISWYGS